MQQPNYGKLADQYYADALLRRVQRLAHQRQFKQGWAQRCGRDYHFSHIWLWQRLGRPTALTAK